MQSVYFPLNLFFLKGWCVGIFLFVSHIMKWSQERLGFEEESLLPGWLLTQSLGDMEITERFSKIYSKKAKNISPCFFSKSSSFFIKMGKFKNGTFLWKSSRNSKDVQIAQARVPIFSYNAFIIRIHKSRLLLIN